MSIETQYLIITGRPDEGHKFYGPFATNDEAMEYAETKMLPCVDWWWITDMTKDCTLEEV